MVDATAYRIVQEALTNMLRHARADRVRVDFMRKGDVLDVRVDDDGRATTVDFSTGDGLAGIRERVSLIGGSVDAGPRPGGGFGVHARLPLGGDR